MLLNLSNHPSTLWPENQITIATQLYGAVTDLPFPHVDPHLETDEVEQLVETYEHKIRRTNPTAVHLMGELIFCHRLANRLQQAGILVVASTTNRKVVYDADGNKISTFEFVQFRKF